MIYIMALIISVVTVEAFLRLSIRNDAKVLLGTLKKSLKIATSRQISDHWKEKILPVYSAKIIVGVLKIATMSVATIFPVILVVAMIEALTPFDNFLWSSLARGDVLVASSVFSWIFYTLRTRHATE